MSLKQATALASAPIEASWSTTTTTRPWVWSS